MKRPFKTARRVTTSVLHTVGTYARTETARKSSDFAALGVIVLILAALTSILYLVQTSNVAIAGYELRALESRRLNLEIRNEQAGIEIDRLKSLAEIEQRATEIGMALPSSVIYVEKPPAPGGSSNAQVVRPFPSTPGRSSTDRIAMSFEETFRVVRGLIGDVGR